MNDRVLIGASSIFFFMHVILISQNHPYGLFQESWLHNNFNDEKTGTYLNQNFKIFENMKTVKHINTLLFIMGVSVIFVSCSKSSSTTPKTSSNTVSTIAGTGSAGATNGTGTSASFTFPSSIVIGPGNVMFVGDFGNSLIRTINLSTAAVSTFAGTGTAGLLNGSTTSAEFNGTANIVFDASGDLFVADEENNVIREITTAGNVITLAGNGTAGYQDGPAASAQFNFPEGMVIDGSGNLYVADGHNNVIRKINIAAGTVSTYAGTGIAGFDNGALGSATFSQPYGMAIDASGNIYVTDIQNNCIRKITVSTGMVSTYAGTGTKGFTNGPASSATFYFPLGCTFDSGNNMYVADTYNNVIRKISASGTVTTFAGTGASGAADGPASSATFNFPIGVVVSGNGIYVADTHNNTIRKITVGQ
jgi:sugar lactone lactonase YvrE